MVISNLTLINLSQFIELAWMRADKKKKKKCVTHIRAPRLIFDFHAALPNEQMRNRNVRGRDTRGIFHCTFSSGCTVTYSRGLWILLLYYHRILLSAHSFK